MRQAKHIKLLVNKREPDVFPLADQLRAAGIDFATLPMSGCSRIIVDGYASYGLEGMRHVVEHLLKEQAEEESGDAKG